MSWSIVFSVFVLGLIVFPGLVFQFCVKESTYKVSVLDSILNAEETLL